MKSERNKQINKKWTALSFKNAEFTKSASLKENQYALQECKTFYVPKMREKFDATLLSPYSSSHLLMSCNQPASTLGIHITSPLYAWKKGGEGGGVMKRVGYVRLNQCLHRTNSPQRTTKAAISEL